MTGFSNGRKNFPPFPIRCVNLGKLYKTDGLVFSDSPNLGKTLKFSLHPAGKCGMILTRIGNVTSNVSRTERRPSKNKRNMK